MKKELYLSVKTHKGEFWGVVIVTVFCFLISSLVTLILIDEGERLSPVLLFLKPMMVGLPFLFFAAYMQRNFCNEFSVFLSFGLTRKEFLTVYALKKTIEAAVSVSAILVLSVVEIFFCKSVIPDEVSTILELFWSHLPWFVFFIPLYTVFSMFFGVVYGKLGAPAYLISTFSLLVAPHLLRLADSDIFIFAFEIYSFASPVILMGLCAVLAAGMVFVIIKLGMRYTVK